MEIARLCKELNVNDKEFEKSVEEFILNRFHSQS